MASNRRFSSASKSRRTPFVRLIHRKTSTTTKKCQVILRDSIDYPPAGGWVQTLMSRINSSSNSALRDRMADWNKTSPSVENSLGDFALAVSSKRAMLPYVWWRLESRLKELDKHLKDEPRMADSLRHGAAYRVRDDKVLWELLLDVDCFLFETHTPLSTFLTTLQRSSSG